LKRPYAWLLAAAVALAGCATTGPDFIPASPLLDVPLSARIRDSEEARRIAQLEINGDWATLAALAAPHVARNPLDAEWRVVFGYARLQQNNYAEAVAALAPVAERSPEEVDAHNLLGEALRLSGHADDARRVLERATFTHPNSHVTRFLLGEVYREGNLLERARGAYSEAIRLAPSFSLGWFGLARVLARTGPRQEYELALKRLQALDPELAKVVSEAGAPAAPVRR
jgi:cytochrome c-type biogenesis protein CcmH/NrfG